MTDRNNDSLLRPVVGQDVEPPQAQQPGDEDSDSWAPICKDAPRAFVPPGEYEAICTGARKFKHIGFKRECIVLQMKIFDGPHAGTTLERFYPAATSGRRNSFYYRHWTVANNGVPPKRRERMTARKFRGKLFRVQVVTVEKAWDGARHPVGVRYSKIGEILELLVTNEWTN